MIKHFLKTALAILAMSLASIGAQAAEDPYITALFAPPTQAEIETAYTATAYAPSCNAYETGEVFEETPNYIIYKVTYMSDGFRQTGIVGFPKSKKPAPLAVVNHFGFDGITPYEKVTYGKLLDAGFAIAMATYRGETGLAGKSEGAMDVLGYELHDVQNLMACVEKLPEIDATKLFLVACSHGSGIGVNLLAHDNRFLAAVLSTAPSNLYNEKMRKTIRNWRRAPATVEVTLSILIPYAGIDILKRDIGIITGKMDMIPAARAQMLRRSPAFFADWITTPTYFYYGGQDPVAFGEDGQAIAASLTRRGIETKVTIFEKSGHAFNASENTIHDTEMIEFLTRKLRETQAKK